MPVHKTRTVEFEMGRSDDELDDPVLPMSSQRQKAVISREATMQMCPIHVNEIDLDTALLYSWNRRPCTVKCDQLL